LPSGYFKFWHNKVKLKQREIQTRERKQEITMLTDYIRAAMRKARYEILPDDGTFYGEIPGFDGVYANADTLERCREELEEILEEWILLRVFKHLPLPAVDGIDLTIKEVA
jgi:predicted RNase H-like HicB family nuclease